ncbi:MAG: hypothetical protein ACJASL_004308 [Paraglaciecola sp.]|jgi:hypothetical protein
MLASLRSINSFSQNSHKSLPYERNHWPKLLCHSHGSERLYVFHQSTRALLEYISQLILLFLSEKFDNFITTSNKIAKIAPLSKYFDHSSYPPLPVNFANHIPVEKGVMCRCSIMYASKLGSVKEWQLVKILCK